MDLVVVLMINGLVWGLIVALIALGLSIIFGLLDIINIAHGDFFMVGTVLAFVISTITGFWWALLLVPIVGLLLGLVVERLVIRPTISAASLTIVTAFGLSMILQEVVRGTFGAQPQRLPMPITETIQVLGIGYDVYRLFAAVFSALSIVSFFLFLSRTTLGTWMRAVRHDPETATALGIPVVRVRAFTFGLGTAMALLGGAIAAPITTVEFRSGVDILPVSFMAVVIGGLGNLSGTVAAAVLLAVIEGLMSSIVDPTIARIASLAVMSFVLFYRPSGLFAGATK